MTATYADSVAVNAGISVLAFGIAPLLKKIPIDSGVTPWMAALISAVGAALVSLVILSRLRPQSLSLLFDRRLLPALVGIGIVATGIVTLLAATALVSTTATNRSLFQAAYPAATLLFSFVLLGERLRRPQYAAIAMLLAGLVVINDPAGGFQFGQGFWLLLATLPLVGLTDVFSKRLSERLPTLVLATGRNLYGALFVAVIALGVELGDQLSAVQAAALLAAGACQGIGVWTLFRAFERGKASLVSSLVAASPFVTLGLEAALRQLTLTSAQWFGMLVVVGAAVWLAQADRRGEE